MQPGQRLALWWQEYVLGRLTSPQDLIIAARADNPDTAQQSERFFDEPKDGFLWEAPKRLQAPAFILSDASFRQWYKADYQQTDPRLMRWSALFIELARKRGIPLYTHCAFRTQEEQDHVLSQGHSKSHWPRSAHNQGAAVDIVHGVYHWTLTRQEWNLLHFLGLRALDLVNSQLKVKDKLSLTWGGNFKTIYDPAHWEITTYRDAIRRLPTLPPVRATPRHILRNVLL